MDAVIQWLDWLGNTELAFEIGATIWFPVLETVHVAALAVLVGNMFVVDLRLLRLAAVSYPAADIVAAHTRWAWGAFACAVVSGAGLFVSRPVAYAENPAFLAKMALLAIAGANVWWFHRRGGGRAHAALSLLLWCGIVLAGRWVGHLNG